MSFVPPVKSTQNPLFSAPKRPGEGSSTHEASGIVFATHNNFLSPPKAKRAKQDLHSFLESREKNVKRLLPPIELVEQGGRTGYYPVDSLGSLYASETLIFTGLATGNLCIRDVNTGNVLTAFKGSDPIVQIYVDETKDLVIACSVCANSLTMWNLQGVSQGTFFWKRGNLREFSNLIGFYFDGIQLYAVGSMSYADFLIVRSIDLQGNLHEYEEFQIPTSSSLQQALRTYPRQYCFYRDCILITNKQESCCTVLGLNKNLERYNLSGFMGETTALRVCGNTLVRASESQIIIWDLVHRRALYNLSGTFDPSNSVFLIGDSLYISMKKGITRTNLKDFREELIFPKQGDIQYVNGALVIGYRNRWSRTQYIQRIAAERVRMLSLAQQQRQMALSREASVHRERGEYQAALDACKLALELDPEDVHARRLISTVYSSLAKKDILTPESDVYCELALHYDQGQADAHLVRGMRLLIEDVNAYSADLEGEVFSYLQNLSSVLQQKSAPKESCILAIDLYVLALVNKAERMLYETLRDLETDSEASSTSSDLSEQHSSQESQKNWEEVGSYFEKALHSNPSFYEAAMGLGRIRLLQERYVDAAEMFRLANDSQCEKGFPRLRHYFGESIMRMAVHNQNKEAQDRLIVAGENEATTSQEEDSQIDSDDLSSKDSGVLGRASSLFAPEDESLLDGHSEILQNRSQYQPPIIRSAHLARCEIYMKYNMLSEATKEFILAHHLNSVAGILYSAQDLVIIERYWSVKVNVELRKQNYYQALRTCELAEQDAPLGSSMIECIRRWRREICEWIQTLQPAQQKNVVEREPPLEKQKQKEES